MERDIRAAEKYYAFQKREWRAFRLFWVLMGLVVTAAALGLFGSGLLSDKTYTANGSRIDYNRFMRVAKNTEILIHVNQASRNASVSINNDYLRKVRIEQVVPEPTSVVIKDNKLVYTFSSVQNGFITFYLSPQKMGAHQLQISVNGTQASFDQYIYF